MAGENNDLSAFFIFRMKINKINHAVMRAKFVFEKFRAESDPVKDMGIGYKKRVIGSKTWKILEFIKSKGEEGAGLTEIQYYIWTQLENKDPDEFWEVRRNYLGDRSGRKTRGHWNTQLFGGPAYHGGILHRFCEKNPKTKKWVFVRFPNPDELLYNWRKR